MKHVTSLVLLSLIALSSCAPPPDASAPAVQSSASQATTPRWTLVATTNGGAVVTLSAPAQITFPIALQGLANASGHRRVDLQIGNTFCAYVANDTSAYIRQDGTCNTFTPNGPVSVNAGDTLTLYIESVDSNNYTSVQADLQGGIYAE